VSSHKPENDKENEREVPEQSRPGFAPEAGPSQTSPEASGLNEAASAASLVEQAKKLEAEKAELMNTLVRRQADFENYRKRVEKERHADRHRGVESLVEHLLPVLDAFDRALAEPKDSSAAADEYRKGFALIRRQLWDALSKQGLKRIESVGKEFDPHRHHAIERVETVEHADGEIVEELQPGYMFHDRVLRPAMVRVAAEPVSKPAGNQ
jgi:molecular chaperone GrpE